MRGRRLEADPRFTVHGSWERAENDADGRGSFAAVKRSMSDRLLGTMSSMSDQAKRPTPHQELTEDLEMRSKNLPATHRIAKPEHVRDENGSGYWRWGNIDARSRARLYFRRPALRLTIITYACQPREREGWPILTNRPAPLAYLAAQPPPLLQEILILARTIRGDVPQQFVLHQHWLDIGLFRLCIHFSASPPFLLK